MGDPHHMDKSVAYRATLFLTRRIWLAMIPAQAASAGNLRRFVLGDMLSPSSREHLIEWMVGCQTGNNRLRGGLLKDWKIGDKTGNSGRDASGDIAIAWPKVGGSVLICAYTQGGSPTPPQFEAVFAEVGRMVGRQMG